MAVRAVSNSFSPVAAGSLGDNHMAYMNMDPLFTFQDGSYLVISTQCSKEGTFSCALYTVLASAGDRRSYQMVSTHLQAETCMSAQAYAYEHAVHLYPRSADQIRKPPYLIWHGPQT
jgi:hypothetical protein